MEVLKPPLTIAAVRKVSLLPILVCVECLAIISAAEHELKGHVLETYSMSRLSITEHCD